MFIRYIKRNGKQFGPYLYQTHRDPANKQQVLNIYVRKATPADLRRIALKKKRKDKQRRR